MSDIFTQAKFNDEYEKYLKSLEGKRTAKIVKSAAARVVREMVRTYARSVDTYAGDMRSVQCDSVAQREEVVVLLVAELVAAGFKARACADENGHATCFRVDDLLASPLLAAMQNSSEAGGSESE